MNNIKWRLGLVIVFVAASFWNINRTAAADGYTPFEGEKTTWHAEFDRYDFIMDDATGAITPVKAPEKEVSSNGIDVTLKDGKRRCVVVVPQKAAPGYPWSWQGCYWNHEPQTEIELLKRGFHIAFVAPDSGRQGKAWDRWYEFLTRRHGLSKKAAFIGMSKGGVNEFNWGVANPEKVACIYADNPALYDEDFARLPELAKHDVPLLHICGTEDMLLQQHTLVVENLYHQLGGAITVIIKEGHAHHPHSLQNPKPIADWIEQHMQPSAANRPAFVDAAFTKSYYYSLEPSYIYLPEERTYATARGLEGTGANAGEVYAWAIANPDKVSCIYARNPTLRSLMTKSPPIDNLAPLAKAGVPILHDCGSLDPWLNDQTRVVEKRYKELGGQITVIIREGEGHFPLAPKDPKPVVDFVLSH